MKILIVKPSSLGDLIHTLPAVRIIRENFPDAHINWLLFSQFKPLGDLFSDIDKCYYCPRQEWYSLSKLFHWYRCIQELRSQYFDYVLDFQGLLRSGLISALVPAGKRIGFADARENAGRFYDQKITIPPYITHAVERNIFLVKSALSCDGSYQLPQFKVNQNALTQAQRLLSDHGLTGVPKLLAITPASRWPSKSWPSFFLLKLSL